MNRSYLLPLVIAGPTASGKSSLALELAKRHDGEIICADSRQFYAGMSIGTACPDEEEKKEVKHHGYGMVDPLSNKIDAGYFVTFALRTIAHIQQRGKRPILVGGTGLYLRALFYGLTDVPKSDQSIASALMAQSMKDGVEKLFSQLMSVDQASLSTIKRNDRYRIIRALEIYALTGKKPSELRQSFGKAKPKILAHWIYKKPSKEWLLDQIKNRVEKMFERGFIEEAKKLRSLVPKNHWALTVMGYQEVLLAVDGVLSVEQAKERIIIRHRQYAKRQYTWFNRENFYRLIIS